MAITLDSLEKNEKTYNEMIKNVIHERADLMRQYSELRRRTSKLTDELEIAKSDFEASQLVQKINDLTFALKRNNLTLEQIGLEKGALEHKIDRQTFYNKIVANREKKENLSKDRELSYCENEVEKCEKALKLYTLLGDEGSILKWQEALESAHKYLEYARQEIKGDKASKKEVENQNEIDEEEQNQEGYSYEEEGYKVKETQQQVLKDRHGKEIGDRTIVWNTDIEQGAVEIDVTGQVENSDGKYLMTETTSGKGNEIISQVKKIQKENKITGENEQYFYNKDNQGNETYFKMIDGKTTFRIRRTERGTTIDNYDKDGKWIDSYEYDKDGQAITPMGDIKQLDDNYVENYFNSQLPYFEAENKDLSMNKDGQKVLESAVQATEKNTRTSTINQEIQNIKNRQQERTQEQSRANEEK